MSCQLRHLKGIFGEAEIFINTENKKNRPDYSSYIWNQLLRLLHYLEEDKTTDNGRRAETA